jgi:hypothetical protein
MPLSLNLNQLQTGSTTSKRIPYIKPSRKSPKMSSRKSLWWTTLLENSPSRSDSETCLWRHLAGSVPALSFHSNSHQIEHVLYTKRGLRLCVFTAARQDDEDAYPRYFFRRCAAERVLLVIQPGIGMSPSAKAGFKGTRCSRRRCRTESEVCRLVARGME